MQTQPLKPGTAKCSVRAGCLCECIWHLGCISFSQLCWQKGGHQKILQCPYSPCAPESLLRMRIPLICWRIELCATKPVHSSPPGLPTSSSAGICSSWAALQQDHGSAALVMQEGGKMFWARFVPTAYHGCCQEIISSSLFDHMETFWGVSGGHT